MFPPQKNVQRLPPIPSILEAKIKLVKIPLSPVDGIPENCEATIDLQPDQIQFLKKAADKLAEPFEDLLQRVKPDLILLDLVLIMQQKPQLNSVSPLPITVYIHTAATLAYIGPPAELKTELKTEEKRQSIEDFTKAVKKLWPNPY